MTHVAEPFFRAPQMAMEDAEKNGRQQHFREIPQADWQTPKSCQATLNFVEIWLLRHIYGAGQ
jgi:hypothetical protein